MKAPQATGIARELQLMHSSQSRHALFHGTSMLPFLQDGAAMIVEPVAWNDIAIGDIVTYRYEDRFPARRGMQKHDQRLLLWCEHWPSRYFKVEKEDVLGRVVSRGRDGSWLSCKEAAWIAATRGAWFKFKLQALSRKALRFRQALFRL